MAKYNGMLKECFQGPLNQKTRIFLVIFVGTFNVRKRGFFNVFFRDPNIRKLGRFMTNNMVIKRAIFKESLTIP